jgi:HAD superfamily hydrolase (TIGR01509 family)
VRARALCLDLDGTLADSLPALRRAYAHMVGSCGGTPSAEEFAALDGLPFHEVAERVRVAHASREASEPFARRYREAVDAEHAASPPRAGARELLAEAAERALGVAVVTSGPAALAERWLAAHALAHRVRHVIGCEAAARGKPAPDPYLAALARLACAAHEARAVEDSATGAASALAAGIPTFALARGEERASFPRGCEFVGALDEICARLSDD